MAKKTQLSPTATPGKRYASFAGKVAEIVSMIKRLLLLGVGK